MFKAVCPFCFQEYTLDDSLLGKTASCRQCRRIFLLEVNTRSSHAPTGTISHEDSGFDLKPPSANISVDSQMMKVPDPQLEKRFSPESGMWNIGDVILGVYEVKPLAPNLPFAEGGVGIVQRIYHREWDMDLAVKSPKPHVFQSESGKQGYEQEAQTWIELGLHPNIVTCYLVRRISNIPRLFSEFVPDGSLRDWMHDGRLYYGGSDAALLRILDIAMQFAWGLEHAHEQNLLHLDVKPANVMMSGQTPKVTDFGLAQVSASLEPDPSPSDSNPLLAAVAGGGLTPGYCSPEQYLAFELARRGLYEKIPTITLRSDIWSWAISILALFHGRSPCKKGGQTARKVFDVYLQTSNHEGRPEMPPALVELLYKCFEEDPSKRPDSMGRIAEELAGIYKDVSGMPVLRHRPAGTTWTPESINNRAASMLDLGKPEEAVRLLDQAAQMLPWHPEITYNQVLLNWRSAKRTDLEALEQIETLIKTRPQSAAAIYALGLLQRERGNQPAALDAFENALEMEAREEYHRAALAAESSLSENARCLDRLPVAEGLEDGVMADLTGQFVLVPIERKRYELRETATGRTWNRFNVLSEEHKRSIPNRIALSEDILWELVADAEAGALTFGIALKRVGAPNASARFRPVRWKRHFGGKKTRSRAVPFEVDLSEKPLSERNFVDSAETHWFAEVIEARVVLYDKRTRKKTAQLLGHEDRITALTFSEDGRFALTGGEDRTMRLWELPGGRCLRTFTSIGGSVDALWLGKEGRFALVLVAGGSLRIWDLSILCDKTPFRAPLLLCHVASAEEIGRQQSEMNRYCEGIRTSLKNLDYTSVLKYVSKASRLSGWEGVRKRFAAEGLWDALSRRSVKTSPADVLCTLDFAGHLDAVSTVVLSLDGNIIASAGRDQTIRLWNISEQKCVGVLHGHTDWVRSLDMTMDARFLVSGSWDKTVRVWNIASGQCIRRFQEPVKSLTKIALNPQGRSVVIGGSQGNLILWDVLSDSVEGRFLAHEGGVNTIRFDRSGRYYATGGDDGQVAVWQYGREEPLRRIKVHQAPVTAAVFSTNHDRILSADRAGRIVVWKLFEDKLEFTQDGHLGDVTALDLLPDDRFFLSCSKDMRVRLESLVDRSEPWTVEGHSSAILDLAVDVAGHRFVTGCEDGGVRVWDIFWNYEFPGWSKMTPRAEKTLQMLLSLYSPDAEMKETPQIDDTIARRILLEMEYRGFGTVLPEELKQGMARLLDDWPGPDNLEMDED